MEDEKVNNSFAPETPFSEFPFSLINNNKHYLYSK